MADYISKQNVIDYLNGYLHSLGYDNTELLVNGQRKALMNAIQDISAVKAADVQLVHHGRWLNHHAIWIDQPKIEGWFVQAKCSECEKWAHVMNPYTKFVDYESCPHCGARMDGGTND